MFNREFFSYLNPPPGAPSSESLWGDEVVPEESDNSGGPVTLGTVFKSSVSGNVTHIRFYKWFSNTDTYTMRLYTIGGSQLATVDLSTAATGWQIVALSSPVAISAETNYVVTSYNPAGGYSDTYQYLFFEEYTNGNHLTARLTDDSPIGNGCYLLGSNGFPDSTFDGSCYFVDIVFVPD